jgi:2-phosphoglycerate kinase
VTAPPTTALLLGGDSGTGKSTVAATLAHDLQLTHVRLDDLWVIARSLADRDTLPAIHAFVDPHASLARPTEDALRAFVDVMAALEPAIATTVRIHIARGEACVVEGICLSPALAARLRDAHSRAVFLVEDDPETIWRTMTSRGDRDWLGLSDTERSAAVALGQRLDRWLRDECARYDLPTVPARPWSDAPKRVLAAWAASATSDPRPRLTDERDDRRRQGRRQLRHVPRR